MHYLQQQRIVAPGYSFLQDTVGQALLYEQNRLIAITRAQLNAADIEALNALLDDSTGLYEITQLKREPKDLATVRSSVKFNAVSRYAHCAVALSSCFQLWVSLTKASNTTRLWSRIIRFSDLSNSASRWFTFTCYVLFTRLGRLLGKMSEWRKIRGVRR